MITVKRIRVAVRHDDPLTQVGLLAAFGRYPDLEVIDAMPVASASSSQAMPTPFTDLPPAIDVLVADYDHVMQRLERQARVPRDRSACKTLVATRNDGEHAVRVALERGANGYVLLGGTFDALALAVREVHAGVTHLGPDIARRLAEHLRREPLSARETEVLQLVVDGLGNKEIARRLDIALGTVKSHLKAIFAKLGVFSRTQAMAMAERTGLLTCRTPAPSSVAAPRRADWAELFAFPASVRADGGARALGRSSSP